MTKERIRKIKNVAAKRQNGLVLVLEDIHDPHNAEAIFRTCDAFGVQKIFLIFEKEKRFNPRRIGRVSSASANKWLDFEIFKSTDACLKKLKRAGYEIVASMLGRDAEDFLRAKFKNKKIALLLGNEHRGISEKAAKLSDRKIMIPMRGFVQSLNVSVTAAVCLFEISRQRKFKPVISKKEEGKLFKNFAMR